MKKTYSVDEVVKMIESGQLLSIAGDYRLLDKLPSGSWIGGTTVYFIGENGGKQASDILYVDVLDNCIEDFKFKEYSKDNIEKITQDRYENGYTILLIPAFTDVHYKYALSASDFTGIYDSPILGWVTGFDLNSQDKPAVYNGKTAKAISNNALALHIKIKDNSTALLEILNIHKQDHDSPEIKFETNSFSATDAIIDGVKQNFTNYINNNGINIKNPLTSDYAGAVINVSIKEVGVDEVSFYAPIFKDRSYYFAKHIPNYEKEFAEQTAKTDGHVDFSCNCILNYLYGNLEGKSAGYPGPITFGEIGYILLNQTMTYLKIEI